MKLSPVYVGVEDADTAYDRIEGVAPEVVHEDVVEFGEYRTVQFVDAEGNEVEVFGIDGE